MATTYEMGFINVPISPTFVGIAGKLNDQLIKPARDAGKKAATEVEKSVEASVKGLERQVAASTKKLGDLDRAHQDSVSKREAQQGKLNAAIAEQSAAEEKYQQALKKGDSGLAELAKVEKAKAKVTGETLKLTKAERDITDAEQKHKAQLEDLRRTTEKYEQAQKDANEEAKSGTSVFDKLRQQIGLAGTEMDDTANKAGGLGDKIMSGLGKVGTGALLGVGAKIGSTVVGSINTAFDKGFGRLQSIEQAETMLGGLGHSAEGIAEIMDNAMDSVSGTAYGFGEAASMAATFAGAGVEQGEELTRMLSLVGDSAAITGADFQEMGSIWTKMASSGKLSTDEMNQLMDRGLGLLPKLQEHYNVTADEARKMVTEGKVSFEDFATIMEDMVGGSSQAMGDTFSGSAANMQAALGRLGAKFMDPIYEVAPSIFQAIGGSVDKLGEYLSPVIEDFAERFAPVMQDFAERLGPWLEESIDKAAESIKNMVEWGREAIEWMKDNQTWLEPLAVGVAAMAGSWWAWTTAIKAYTAATKIASTVTAIFDKITKKTIFGAIAMAVIGLVAALTYFFTKTETGQKIWEKFTDAIGSGWDWVTEKLSAGFEWISGAWDSLTGAFSAGWENYIKPVWDGLVTAGKYAAAILGTLVLAPIMVAWNLLSDAFKVGWETVIKPVWDALSAAATWLWETILQPVFTSIGDGWQSLSDRFTLVWETIRTAVFDAFNWYIDRVKANWELVTGALSAAWSWVRDIFVAVFDEIRDRVFIAFEFYVDLLKSGFELATGAMSVAWNWLKDILGSAWGWMRDNVFSKFEGTISTVKSSFETAVDAIGKAWESLKALLAAPVNFVIETIYMNGVREAWGAVAGLVDLPDLPKVEKIGGFSEGTARVPGARTRHDNIHMRSMDGRFGISLRGGEGVVVPEVVDALGEGTINDLNRVALQRGVGGVQHYLEHLGGFSQGGIIDSMMGFVNKHFPGLQMTSGWRFTDTGMHSRGQAADFSNQSQGGPSTPESRALAKAIYTNFPNQTEQLIHWQEDGWKNLLSGQPFNYGEPTNSQHTDHVHWGLLNPLNYDADELDLSGGGGGIFETITAMAKRLWDGIINKIPSFDGVSQVAELPGAFLGKVAGAAWDHIKSLADKIMSPFTGGSGGGAEQWRDLARTALSRFGYGDQYLDAMVKQIEIESTGDPNAVNNWDSNAARGTPSRGLLQVIDPTYRDVRNRYPDAFAGLPDDPTHPLTNLVAGIGALERDWGGPAGGRWPTVDGYSEGGIVDLFTRDMGGWVPNGALVRNTSGRDELMLPPELSQAMAGFFADYPEAAEMLAVAADHIESAAEFLSLAADRQSEEGIVARASMRRILDLRLELPGSVTIGAFLDAEESMWASRERHLGHLDNLVEKEEALEKARKALDELESSEDGLGTKDQRKLDDAQAAVEEAKANVAKADSDEKRAKATEKLADSEEKLRRVREDLAENATKNAEKRAEDITKANAEVVKSEQALIEAKKQQVKDLDSIIVLSQESIGGLQSQVSGFADQLIGMGAPAGMVSQGLGAVTGALSSVAGMAGPAGISLGMAFDLVKTGIELVTTIVDAVVEIIEKVEAARMAALEAVADGWRVIADYAALVAEMQHNVSTLQQEIVRGLNDQRTAEFALRVAQHDRLIAEASGIVSVAEARLGLDKEIERGNIAAQLRLMGLHEDWDSYLSFQALASQGMLDQWSDAAIGALFTYEAARAKALQGELAARLDQINAEAALAQATRQNFRNQQDLLKAQERLIMMSAEVAGVDLVDATASAQAADLILQMAENRQQRDSNWLGRAGTFLGTDGPWSNEVRGKDAEYAMLKDTLDVLTREYGVNISDGDLNKAIKQMQSVGLTDGDQMAVLRQFFPELIEAERVLQLDKSLSPIWGAEDQRTDREREEEDFLADIGLFDKTNPLQETIKGLDYTIAGLEDAASAWADGNEDLRSEYLGSAWANYQAGKNLGVDWQLDGTYATPGVRDQIVKEVHIQLDGADMYTADQVDQLVQEAMSGTNAKPVVHINASTVAKSKRGVLA